MSYLDDKLRQLQRVQKQRDERIARAEPGTVVPMDDYRDDPPAQWRDQHSALRWVDRVAPPRPWLLEPWMPLRQTTSLYGDGGTGKSLLAQQLATCVALGRPFMSIPVKQGPVLCLFCEDDDDELLRRQTDINAWLGISMGDLDDYWPISRIGQDNIFMTFSHGVGTPTPIWLQWREMVGDCRPALAVVDTAADTFSGNENDRQEVRQYVQRCLTSVAVEFDCSVLLCAHPSKSGIASGEGDGGNTAWNNSVRSRLYMERPKEPGEGETDPDSSERILSRKKSNYAAKGETIRVYWGQGVFWEKGQASERRDRETRARDVFLELMDVYTRRKSDVSHAVASPFYGPRLFKKEARAREAGATESLLHAAMMDLIDRGVIEAQEVGRGKKVLVRRNRAFENPEW